jgi:hypothetical protein
MLLEFLSTHSLMVGSGARQLKVIGSKHYAGGGLVLTGRHEPVVVSRHNPPGLGIVIDVHMFPAELSAHSDVAAVLQEPFGF